MSLPKQNTPEWLEWRKDKIGASDVPIIVGVSPYCTPLKLWKKKLGFLGEEKQHPGMRWGHENEGAVRQRMQIKYGLRIDDKTCVSSEYDWASASLDGIDENGVIYEIKSCNSIDHEIARSGNVPEKYMPQVQWQLFCVDATLCRYVSSHKDEDLVVEVTRDNDLLDEYLLKIIDFKECLDNWVEPALTDSDHLHIDDLEFGEAAMAWQNAKQILDEAKKQEVYWKEKLVDLTDDSNCEGFGVRLTRVNSKGTIDWNKFCETKGIVKTELEEFRKPQIGFWKVTTIK